MIAPAKKDGLVCTGTSADCWKHLTDDNSKVVPCRGICKGHGTVRNTANYKSCECVCEGDLHQAYSDYDWGIADSQRFKDACSLGSPGSPCATRDCQSSAGKCITQGNNPTGAWRVCDCDLVPDALMVAEKAPKKYMWNTTCGLNYSKGACNKDCCVSPWKDKCLGNGCKGPGYHRGFCRPPTHPT